MDFFEVFWLVNKTINNFRKLYCFACMNCCSQCEPEREHYCHQLDRGELFRKAVNWLVIEQTISIEVYRALLIINDAEATRPKKDSESIKQSYSN